MEITIKMNNGQELAGILSGIFQANPLQATIPGQSEEMEAQMERQREKQGDRVKELRKLTGMTQERFANKYEIPKRTLEKWETGERVPPVYVINMLERIVQAEEDMEKAQKEHLKTLDDIAEGRKVLRKVGGR